MAQAPAPYAGQPQEVQEPDSLLPHARVLGRGTYLKSVCEGPKGCGFAALLLGGDVMDSPARILGCCALLQRIFPTQGSNLGLLHCTQILYHLIP